MSSVLERAKAHYDSLGVESIEVPEWGDENGPLVIYWSPLTVHEQGSIFRKARKDDITALVDLVILKAQDADGNKLFSKADQQQLARGVASDVISRIASAMNRTDDPEEAAGN